MHIFEYDKLWGPSQRVVTLFYDRKIIDPELAALDEFCELRELRTLKSENFFSGRE